MEYTTTATGAATSIYIDYNSFSNIDVPWTFIFEEEEPPKKLRYFIRGNELHREETC